MLVLVKWCNNAVVGKSATAIAPAIVTVAGYENNLLCNQQQQLFLEIAIAKLTSISIIVDADIILVTG